MHTRGAEPPLFLAFDRTAAAIPPRQSGLVDLENSSKEMKHATCYEYDIYLRQVSRSYHFSCRPWGLTILFPQQLTRYCG